MTFEDIMQMKRLGETAVSPDGKWLAYSVTTVDLAKNTKTPELWLQAIAGGEPFKLGVGQPGDSGVQFSADGRRILWISSREGGGQVWLADFDTATGAASNAKKLTAIVTEAGSPKWSPDGNFVVFLSSVYPDCPPITTADFAAGNQCNADRDKALAESKVKAQIWTHLLYRHWDHYTGEKRSHLFLVSVETGAIRDLTPNDPRDVPPFSLDDSSCGCNFSPDSKELAFTENLDPEPATSISASIFTLDLTDPSSKAKKISTSAGGNFNPAYSPDGKWLAWRSEARAGYESDKFRLVVYDRAKGSESASQQAGESAVRDLMPNFDSWVEEFIWASNSREILFTSGAYGAVNIYRATLLEQSPASVGIVVRGGEFSGLAMANVGSKLGTFDVYTESIIATRTAVDQPAEAVAIPLWSNLLQKPPDGVLAGSPAAPEFGEVTHLNSALLTQLDLPAMESFSFEPEDKSRPKRLPVPCSITMPQGLVGVGCPLMIEGFLIRPPGFDAKKKYPVKFLIHGGPQGAWGDAWSYRWNAELFAANGYVVVMVNPRGSTGYGQAFVDAVNGDWGGKPYTDLMTGLDYAEQHYPFIDKTRECALGASYGGYMANWVLGHTNRFKCIVSHDGVFNAESAFGSTEEDWFNIWEFKGHPWDYYGKPDSENPFRKWSPSLYAKNFKTPTLVIHGQLDYRLDLSEGLQLFDTLQLLKVPSKMLYFPDEGHWVLKPQNSQLWYKAVNDWMDEWTKTSR